MAPICSVSRPTAPRDFVVCLLSSEYDSEERECGHAQEKPKQYMVVSIPVEHPEAPLKSGLVRGQYESVEIIRQVKDWSKHSMSTVSLPVSDEHERRGRFRGHTIGFSESRGGVGQRGRN